MPRRTSAFNRALQEAQQQDNPAGEHSAADQNTVEQQDRPTVSAHETVAPAHSDTVELSDSEEDLVVKTSFYPLPNQLDKLDDLAAEFNRRYRRKRPRINRNHIVRFLIDLVDIDMLDELNPKS